MGLATLVSVTMLAPGPDAHQRPDNPLKHGNTTGQANLLFWGGLLTGAPPAALLALGIQTHNEVLRWSARGSELLFTMRTGRSAVTRTRVELSKRDATMASVGWTFGPILLFPQGIVPMILLVVDPSVKVWFLAMYLPAPLGWGCAAVMAVLGSWVIWAASRAGRCRKAVRD